jgi:hypothetical protein
MWRVTMWYILLRRAGQGAQGTQGARVSCSGCSGYSGELTEQRVSRGWLAPEQEQQAYEAHTGHKNGKIDS